MLGKGLEFLSEWSQFDEYQLLVAENTALVADSRRVLYLGKVCGRRKLSVNVGKSKVVRCSRALNVCETKWRTVGGSVFFLSTRDRKWQRMEDVKKIWYTELV